MPLTEIQKDVLGLLAPNRSRESHFAGGLVLNAPSDSARFSKDFDIFQDTADGVAQASELDARTLEKAGFEVHPTRDWDGPETFRKAVILKDDARMEIDWAMDSPFRYFPVEADPLMGFRLHLFDIATNKALALAARSETRDYIDILELGRLYTLQAICWAAPGKDEGYSPLFLLKMMLRFAKIVPGTLEKIKARDLDPIEMKKEWLGMADAADEAIERVADHRPDLPIGCAFVGADNHPRWIEEEEGLRLHLPCVGGSWPGG